MNDVDEEITALVLTTATHPVPEVRAAAEALVGRVKADGPIWRHLESSLRRATRDYGWEIGQEARLLVRDLQLTRPAKGLDEAELARSLSSKGRSSRRRHAA